MAKTYAYKFVKNDDKYEITEKALFNPYHIERILGKVTIKNKVYELIEIKGRWANFEGVYLTERKNLTFKVLASFVSGYSGGDRSEQWHPYKRDLLDPDLLDDIGMEVFTYKHFYSGTNEILDCYLAVKKDEATEELINALNERSVSAVNEADRLRALWESHKPKEPKWEPITEGK